MAAKRDGTAATPDFLPLPVVDGATLTYERFLREFALPKQPCVITNIGATWAARDWSVDYFLAHESVDKEHEVSMADGAYGTSEEVDVTVGEALRMVVQRADQAAAADGNGGSAPAYAYLSAWNYVRGGSAALQEDFEVPSIFERAPKWARSHAVLGNSAVDMRWLYIGASGTGSRTHVDCNLSSAWLWVATGRKEWICAHGEDHELLTGGVAGRGSSDYGDDDSAALPDLFASDLHARWPHVRKARLYHGFQNAGDVCFNPSCCAHAVRNVGAPGALTISLTHNFVDATNLADVIHDATRSILDELLPMAASLKPKTVLKTMATTLHVKRARLERILRELPDLLSDAHVEDALRAAADAEAGVEAASAVEALLRETLTERLATVRPAFVSAATRLRDALGLDDEVQSVS